MVLLAPLLAQTTVIKYAFNDSALKRPANHLARTLEAYDVHLALLDDGELFKGDGGLVGLKMGYIELYSLNATELHGVIFGIWPMLSAAKNGDDRPLRSALDELGFELIGTRFERNRTLITLAHPRRFSALPSQVQRAIMDNLP
jgi:hypothetical protein